MSITVADQTDEFVDGRIFVDIGLLAVVDFHGSMGIFSDCIRFLILSNAIIRIRAYHNY